MLNHFVVAEVADISDLESYSRLELLQFEEISHCGSLTREGSKRTRLGGRYSVDWRCLRKASGPIVGGGKKIRSLLCVEKRRDVRAHRREL